MWVNSMESCDMASLVGESLGCAVLGSGCTSTVCGMVWLKCYLDTLGYKDKELVQENESKKWFRFGTGKKVQSQKKVRLPCEVAGTMCYVNTEVVMCDIPLLLSKQSLKKAKAVLDLNKDKVEIFGKVIDLKCTSSGHYCIDITPASKGKDENIMFAVDRGCNLKGKKKMVVKLHRQFAHPTERKLKLLLSDAGVCDKDFNALVKEVSEDCEICLKYK